MNFSYPYRPRKHNALLTNAIRHAKQCEFLNLTGFVRRWGWL